MSEALERVIAEQQKEIDRLRLLEKNYGVDISTLIRMIENGEL